jgi:hypothetical protein
LKITDVPTPVVEANYDETFMPVYPGEGVTLPQGGIRHGC